MAHLITIAVFLLATIINAAPSHPHIVTILVDDWGWADVGYHRNGEHPEVQTPNIDALVTSGVELDRNYVHQFCSPSRSSIQTGRLPIHVNVLNLDEAVHNPDDPVSGFAAVPRNMTGIATRLREASYRTHFVGKWDAGMATPDHTPHGRGYDTSLLYFHHANDYWVQTAGELCNGSSVVDLWSNDGPAFGLNNSWDCSQQNQRAECTYEDDLFAKVAVSVIENHDAAGSAPMFLFFAPHNVHEPLQVPQWYMTHFDFIDYEPRQKYLAMVAHLDDVIGSLVTSLVAKGMWNDTLLVVSSDNGGPIYNNGNAGANNWPLHGGKMSNWEGGVRVNGFVSGGIIPPAQRGKKTDALVSIADWYATFCGLAGIDPFDAAAASANLPPVESFNLWPLLSGANATAPRTELAIGVGPNVVPGHNLTTVQGLIIPPYKLLIGPLGQDIWQGPQYPNASTDWVDTPRHCGNANGAGCLYNIWEDPTEHEDIAAAHPDIVARLRARMDEIQATTFTPRRGTDDGAACSAAMNKWGGFWGPFLK